MDTPVITAVLREIKVAAWSATLSTIKAVIFTTLLVLIKAGEFWYTLGSLFITIRALFYTIYGEYEYQQGAGTTVEIQIVRYFTNSVLMLLLILSLGLDGSIQPARIWPVPTFDMGGALKNRSILDENNGIRTIWSCNFRSTKNHCWTHHGVPGALVFLGFLYLSRCLWIDYQRIWMNALILIYKIAKLIYYYFKPKRE